MILYTETYLSVNVPIYVILGKLTFKAIEAMKSAKERDSEGERLIKAAGGKLLSHYYTFGHYDFVITAELPSTEALVKVFIEIGKWGTVSTETLTALLPEQVYKVAMES